MKSLERFERILLDSVPRLQGDTSSRSWSARVNRGTATEFGFDFTDASRFEGAINSSQVAGMRTFSVVCEPHLVYRVPSQASDADTSCYFLTLQISGSKRITQSHRSSVLKAGQFALYDSDSPVELEIGRDYRSINIRFRKSVFDLPDSGFLNELITEPLSANEGIAPFVWTTLLNLGQYADSIGHESVQLRHNMVELASLMLRAKSTQGWAAMQQNPQVSPRLTEVKSFIEAHLGDPDLGVEFIAAENFMSVRNLHKLFSATGDTVAAWIRMRRIDSAKHDLANPASALSITEIAEKWGFHTGSHFSYVFKQITGVTPSQYRRDCLQ